VEVSNM